MPTQLRPGARPRPEATRSQADHISVIGADEPILSATRGDNGGVDIAAGPQVLSGNTVPCNLPSRVIRVRLKAARNVGRVVKDGRDHRRGRGAVAHLIGPHMQPEPPRLRQAGIRTRAGNPATGSRSMRAEAVSSAAIRFRVASIRPNRSKCSRRASICPSASGLKRITPYGLAPTARLFAFPSGRRWPEAGQGSAQAARSARRQSAPRCVPARR